MDQEQLNIEVSISHQLRALLAQRLAVPENCPDTTEAEEESVQTPPDSTCLSNLDAMPTVGDVYLLRRDGARPIRFEGQVLLDISHVWTLPGGAFDHRVVLYLGAEGSLCASLHLEPRNPETARPSFRCTEIHDGSAFETFARHWVRDILTGTALKAGAWQDTDTKTQSGKIETVFHDLTEQSLRVLQRNSERNKQCLQ